MLYNKTSIKTNFYGVVGFQNDSPEFSDLFNAANTASSSGRYFNEFHPMINGENLKAIYTQFSESTPFANFNALVADKVKTSCIKAVDRLFQKKKPQIKGIQDKRVIFNDSLNLSEKISASGRFVGFNVRLMQGQNAKLSFNRVALALDSTEAVDIYVFHDSQ